jgi:DnaJ-class molecular chaperone
VDKCPVCNGYGYVCFCKVCNGTGTVNLGNHPATGEPMLTVCRACYQGKTRPRHCAKCNGTGMVEREAKA